MESALDPFLVESPSQYTHYIQYIQYIQYTQEREMINKEMTLSIKVQEDNRRVAGYDDLSCPVISLSGYDNLNRRCTITIQVVMRALVGCKRHDDEVHITRVSQ